MLTHGLYSSSKQIGHFQSSIAASLSSMVTSWSDKTCIQLEAMYAVRVRCRQTCWGVVRSKLPSHSEVYKCVKPNGKHTKCDCGLTGIATLKLLSKLVNQISGLSSVRTSCCNSSTVFTDITTVHIYKAVSCSKSEFVCLPRYSTACRQQADSSKGIHLLHVALKATSASAGTGQILVSAH